jgi:bifunctional DNA-binding transcriptional regulator/antitoxin component of YhaV-PrlF toxin-antitoxin module
MKSTLTVTSKGQVTLRKVLLDHLGVRPGDKVTVETLLCGKAELRAARAQATIDDFVGAGRARLIDRADQGDCRARVGRGAINITPDTNLLVRLAVDDDPEQVRIACAILRKASLVAVAIPSLCEFASVPNAVIANDR